MTYTRPLLLTFFRLLLGVVAVAAWGAPLHAAVDPPARVGRLSQAEGEVTFQLAGQDVASQATPNWPISSGARLVTGQDGWAEVQVGANTFRIAQDSDVEFTRVDDQEIALRMARGRLALSAGDAAQAGDVIAATPVGRIRFEGAGRYRIDVDAGQGDTQVSSRMGTALIDRPGGQLGVPAGRRALVMGAGGWYLDEGRPDQFDAWVDARDAESRAALARHYVSPQMTGYEDLDRYGDWGSSYDYGTVWYPRAVPAGWAPYRYGRWAWVSPWGWTWVDEAPWGFAPFHYGRWVFVGERWGWVPGVLSSPPVYAPALVAWVGGPGGNLSVGPTPAIGWIPLAPQEVFVPAYHCSTVYVRRLNTPLVSNPAIIQRAVADPHAVHHFVNRNVAQAVTVVPASVVRSGRPIAPALLSRHDGHGFDRVPVSARGPDAKWLPPTSAARQPQVDPGRIRVAPGPSGQAALAVPPGGAKPSPGQAAAAQEGPAPASPAWAPGRPHSQAPQPQAGFPSAVSGPAPRFQVGGPPAPGQAPEPVVSPQPIPAWTPRSPAPAQPVPAVSAARPAIPASPAPASAPKPPVPGQMAPGTVAVPPRHDGAVVPGAVAGGHDHGPDRPVPGPGAIREIPSHPGSAGRYAPGPGQGSGGHGLPVQPRVEMPAATPRSVPIPAPAPLTPPAAVPPMPAPPAAMPHGEGRPGENRGGLVEPRREGHGGGHPEPGGKP